MHAICDADCRSRHSKPNETKRFLELLLQLLHDVLKRASCELHYKVTSFGTLACQMYNDKAKQEHGM